MTLPDHITRENLAPLLEPFLFTRLPPERTHFRVRTFRPALTWNRLDLAIKQTYLGGLTGLPSDFATRLYREHIAAFSLGDMNEPGNTGKRTLADFVSAFDRIYRDTADRGFDPARSMIPLASDGTILNGAHRTAAALHLGQRLVGVETGLAPVTFDAAYFEDRGMAPDLVDAAVLKYIEQAPHAAVAVVWPAAAGRDRAVARMLGPVLCQRAYRLSVPEAKALLTEVYADEPWLGPPEAGYPGVVNKLAPCFSDSGDLRIMVFDAPQTTDRVALKDEIRALFGIGKHSIHITDTHDEACRVAHMLLSPAGRHFLAQGNPTRFSATRGLARRFRSCLDARMIDPETVVVDSGMVLGVYGLREAQDVDFLSPARLDLPVPFEWHGPERHAISLGDLVQDPAQHFRHAGLKFASLANVAAMKAARKAGRDVDDLDLIRPILDSGPNPASAAELARVRRRILVARLRRRAIAILRGLGLKDPVQRIYHRIRRR